MLIPLTISSFSSYPYDILKMLTDIPTVLTNASSDRLKRQFGRYIHMRDISKSEPEENHPTNLYEDRIGRSMYMDAVTRFT